MPLNFHEQPVLVCGLGVIGLTTSIRLLQKGHPVIAVAEHLPGDPLTAIYASAVAGAHHLSFAADDDERQQAVDRRTFEVMWEEEHTEGEASALLKLRQIEYYESEGEKHIKFFEGMPDFRVHSQEELRPFAKHTVSFTTLTIDTPAYLAKLVKIFSSLGGIIHRARISSLQDAMRFVAPQTPRAIVNCTGLGSRKLVDVLDDEMYPIRGQVVILNAPWVQEGLTRQGGARTYIIPRKSGYVVIGGTRDIDDWNPDPVPETSLDIKRRALEILPGLVPPHLRVEGHKPGPEDLDSIIVREVVGFRPARRSGLRLERGNSITANESAIPVLHNYGHSGAGWQSSWGCAEIVVKLFEDLDQT